ncbi:MAG: GNAT family N-acetyltransferase [Bacteroidetes bacterium]|nr:GNAT family N-acetyltransferase [Bacteroidota bacterium]
MEIRFAINVDLKCIVDIYNQAIKAGNATADLTELYPSDRKEWFIEHNENEYPIYVLEINKKIIGWGSLSPYRKGRAGLRTTAEISYYIDYNYHGHGYGKKLIDFIITDCKRLGIKNLFALLLEINETSVIVLERFGFTKWGFMPDVANLNGITCGHFIYGRKIDQ